MNCKGSLLHNTACGICVKCSVELADLKNPKLPPITEEILNQWEVHASSLDLLAIVALARHGLWAGNHSKAIVKALNQAQEKVSRGVISPFEKALDSCPKELR